MNIQHLQAANPAVMSDPEWIALESIEDKTRHFIFDDTMLRSLRQRGLVEPSGENWRVTERGRKTLNERVV